MAILIAACLSAPGMVVAFMRPLTRVRPRYMGTSATRLFASTVAAPPVDSRIVTGHPMNNVPVTLAEKIGKNLHRTPNHPLGIIKDKYVLS